MSSPFTLALPTTGGSTATGSSSKRSASPSKEKEKRKRKRKDRASGSNSAAAAASGGGGAGGGRGDDSDVEVSDNDLVAAEPEREGNEDDDEDADGEGGGVETGRRGDAKRIGAMVKKRKGDTLLLRGELDTEQAKRFDAFSTAVIPKQVVRKINKDLYDQAVPGNLLAVIGGMAKIFVADVIELAKEIQAESDDPNGPLLPHHLKLARLRLEEVGVLGSTGSTRSTQSSVGLRPRKPLFRR